MDSFYREVLIQCILGFVECVKQLRMTPDVTFLFLLSARQYVYLAIKGVSLNDHNLTFSLATTHLSNDSPSRRQTHHWQDEWQRRDRFRHSTLSKCQKKKGYKLRVRFGVLSRSFPCKGVEWCLTNSKLSMLLLVFLWYFYLVILWCQNW